MEWRERLTLIWTMVRKDLAHAGIPILACAVVAATIAFLLGPAALASSRFPTAFRWFDSSLRPFFAISAALTGFTFAITFYEVYGGEIRSGTIRSIILYPVDANDIAFAKLGSALVITFILTTILFFGALAPFFALGIWPVLDFLAIHLMALGAGFVSLSTGVFLAHVLAHYAKRIVISPAGLGTLFIIGSMLLTELIANGIAFQITLLLARSRDQFPTPEETRAALAFAQTVSVLSPYHWGARILSQGFGIFPAGGEPLIAISVALTLLAIVGGFILGKKLYLDIFTR